MRHLLGGGGTGWHRPEVSGIARTAPCDRRSFCWRVTIRAYACRKAQAIMLAVPGAMDAGVTSALFWGALAFSLLVASC
jgi:hypothetical protein